MDACYLYVAASPECVAVELCFSPDTLVMSKLMNMGVYDTSPFISAEQ